MITYLQCMFLENYLAQMLTLKVLIFKNSVSLGFSQKAVFNDLKRKEKSYFSFSNEVNYLSFSQKRQLVVQ